MKVGHCFLVILRDRRPTQSLANKLDKRLHSSTMVIRPPFTYPVYISYLVKYILNVCTVIVKYHPQEKICIPALNEDLTNNCIMKEYVQFAL